VGLVLEAKGLGKSFVAAGSTVHALRDVSFKVEEGEFVSIVGPSGAGKSTLLYLLGGLERPTQGTVTVEGKELSKLSERDLTLFRRARTGFVFQLYNLLPTLDVRENIALPFSIAGLDGSDQRDRAEDMIELFGLRGRERHRPNQLSTGEQQRVAIAKGFLTNPAILIADEPTGNVDSSTGIEIIQLLWESCDNFGQTIMLVTHQPRVAAFADRVLFLKDGALVDQLVLGRRDDHHDPGAVIDRLQELGL